MGRMIDADDLISSADIAAIFGVTRAAVSNWKRRWSDFPNPVARVGPVKNIDLYLRSEILAWVEKNMEPQTVLVRKLVRKQET